MQSVYFFALADNKTKLMYDVTIGGRVRIDNGYTGLAASFTVEGQGNMFRCTNNLAYTWNAAITTAQWPAIIAGLVYNNT